MLFTNIAYRTFSRKEARLTMGYDVFLSAECVVQLCPAETTQMCAHAAFLGICNVEESPPRTKTPAEMPSTTRAEPHQLPSGQVADESGWDAR